MKKLQLFKKKEITNHHISPECLNCGKPLATDDIFCSYCGQKNIEKLTFGSFISQLVSGFFSYDSRFWTTFIPILLKPGVVSRNYIDGKRARYVNPFQMYLQVSILFFLIIGITSNSDENFIINDNATNQTVIDSVLTNNINKELLKQVDTIDQRVITSYADGVQFSEMLADSTYQYRIKNDTLKRISFTDKIEDFSVFIDRNPEISKAETALSNLGYPVSFWNSFYFEQTQKMKVNFEELKKNNGKEFLNKFISKLSIGLFIFLPLFTLFFKFIYFRKHLNYMEHLIFVFHTQTVFFLLMIIFITIHRITSIDVLGPFLIIFLTYLYMAMLKFYEQRWPKTFIKFILLNAIYMSIGGIAMIIISIIAFMFG